MRSESKIFHRWSADVRVYRLKLSKKSFMLTTPSQTLFQGRFCLGITMTWICTQVLINLNFKEFQPGLTSRHGHWTFDGHFKIESRISALLMRKHNMNIKLTGDINSRRQLTGGWSTMLNAVHVGNITTCRTRPCYLLINMSDSLLETSQTETCCQDKIVNIQ